MKFSIIHPTARVTRDASHYWLYACQSAMEGCSHGGHCDVEYIVVVHHSRVSMFYHELSEVRSDCSILPVASRSMWGRFTVVVNYGRDCLVDQCNAGQIAASGEIQCWNQDDMRYPDHWDTEILKLLPDTSILACVQASTDGTRRDLLTLPVIATKRLTDAIGMLSSEYESMYCDDEWSLRARQLGVVIPASHLYFQHLHPVNGTAKMDEVYAQENRAEAYRIGRETFDRRKDLGFPRVAMPGESGKMEKSDAPRTIDIVIPGESHREEWMRAFLRLYASLINQGWGVRVHTGTSTNVYQVRIGLAENVLSDALSSGAADFVLWIDDDNTPSPEVVAMLVKTLQNDAELAGAAGWCWIKTKDDDGKDLWITSCGMWRGETLNLRPLSLVELFADDHSPKRIEWSGFPTLLMRFSALLEMGAKSFRPVLADDNEMGFTGEDISFFHRARHLKFVVVPDAEVHHWKVQPLRPDYVIHEGASPEAVAVVEADRSKLNGPRISVTKRIRDIVGALAGIM